MQTLNAVLLALLLGVWPASRSEAKSYSSGGGHSYSSHSSSSHSSPSGGSISHSTSRSSSGSSSGARSGSSEGASSSRPGSSSGSGSKSSSPGASGSGSSGSGSGVSKSSSAANTKSGAPGTAPPAPTRSASPDTGSKTYQSSSGKSYSSGSTWSEDGRHSYTAGKSYTSGSGHTFGSSSAASDSVAPAVKPAKGDDSASSRFNFDSAAARARKEEASQKDFARFKESQVPSYAVTPPPLPNRPASAEPVRPTEPPPTYRVQPPPLPNYQRRVYIPETEILVSRPRRIQTVFYPYASRPVVVYRDSYNSFFWWWLLDRSLDERAQWAYHHRSDMDPTRYQALMATNQELEARVEQLEAQQVAPNPDYVPPGLDRDLMYSDRFVEHAYSNRPTIGGKIAFGVLAIPAALALGCFFVWFIFFKHWQTSSSTSTS